MSLSCHGAAEQLAPVGTPVVALVGAPNVGKSTLFNTLTGLRVTMGNWPGTTVDVSRAVWKAAPERPVALFDLPGAYSLDPLSPDEELTRDLLAGDGRPDLVVVVADAAHLARSLFMVSQVREQAGRVIVALTMNDIARHRGLEIDPDALAATIGCPVVPVDPRRRGGLAELTALVLDTLGRPALAPRTRVPGVADVDDERFAWVEQAVARGVRPGEERANWSDRIDRWLTAPVLGPLIFLAVMWVVFQVTTTVAAPLQDALDGLFSGPLTDAAGAAFAALGWSGSWVEGLVVDGLIAGVGMLLTFVPLMALMFILLAILEDSGYLARAAVVTDRLMRAIGLPGKAFLPLVVGFGCNVPAISATRILGDARQRILTSLLVPFTSCTARLTVYVMLASVFFPDHAGTVVFVMYLASILFVVLAGLLLRSTLWRSLGGEPLVLDLPPYQWPTARLVASVAWQRLAGFLRTASGIIVITVCLVWLAQSIPGRSGAGTFGDVAVADSVYGLFAQAIAPVFVPTGFAAWQTVSALVVGFVAKEAVLTSWAQTFAVAEGDLGSQLLVTFAESSGGHPLPAVAAFLVFLMAYTPCVATIAAQRREIGGRWTLFGVVMQLAVSYVAAVAVFQVGRLFW